MTPSYACCRALRKPVVALFGPTEPRRTGPYAQLEHILQLDLPVFPV